MTDEKPKTSEAQKRATQAYREKNREKVRKQSAQSSARTFIRKYANIDDLKELEQLIDDRKKSLDLK
ncbi:hypothetical protein [Enterococcus sp.]|uniref:hypothetical protein n=1 Tax=Enterococcus sp. TaxID=35783 RepID=UPI003C76E26F